MNTRPRLPTGVRRAIAAQLAKPSAPAVRVRMRRACLYKVDRLGDFVLALGALHSLVKNYGANECRLVVSTVAAPLAALEFPDVPRWELPPDASGVWREIRPLRNLHATAWAGENFAELVCLRHARNVYRDITLSWIRARAWRGFDPRPGPRELSSFNLPQLAAEYPPTPALPWCRELLAHREIVSRVAGVMPGWAELRPRLHRMPPMAGEAWVFCPFGNDPQRGYPIDRWIEAWRVADLPAGPVDIIGPESRATELNQLAVRLRTEAGRAKVNVLTDLLPLEFIEKLAHARGIVTVESAAAHFATAFDKPAVIVTGGGHYGWFAPWGDAVRQRWLVNELPCFGCQWECRFPTVRCLVELPANAVARALQEVMPHD